MNSLFKKLSGSIIFLIFFFLFLFSSKASAQNMFLDGFFGTGDLHQYNPGYSQINPFASSSLVSDHLESLVGDSFYAYLNFNPEDNCTSYDFKNDLWVAVMLRTKTDLSQWDEIQLYGGDSWNYYRNGALIASGVLNYDTHFVHNIKACVQGEQITGYMDNQLFFSGNTPNVGGFSGFGLYSPSLLVDNFKISNFKELNVPSFKQTDSPWNIQIYDTATQWSSASFAIKQWGCAITSVSMLLRYYGLNKLPDGSDLNPGTLNNWLKGQKDGYVGNGFLNWLSISRLTKLSRTINGINTFDALIYKRKNGMDKTLLTNDLNNNRPVILEEPGHYIVAKGEEGSSYLINDPFYNRGSLSDYSDSFLSLNRYIPSNTDLSYIMLNIDPEINISLRKPNDEEVGEVFLQGPLSNPENSPENNSSIKILYLEQPEKYTYKLLISSITSKTYDLVLYFYDVGGNVKSTNLKGVISPAHPEEIAIAFDKNNLKYSTENKLISYRSAIRDIGELNNIYLIDKKIGKNLVNLLTGIEKIHTRADHKLEILNLKLLKKALELMKKQNLINNWAFEIIIVDIDSLIKAH
jgi:hypothetical protein